MKRNKLLILLIIIFLLILLLASLFMTARALLYNFLKDTTEEGVEFIKECNYPYINQTYEYVPINNSGNPPIALYKKTKKEEINKMIRWCCENYNNKARICNIQQFAMNNNQSL